MNFSDMVTSWRDNSDGFFKFLDDVKPVVRASGGSFTPFVPGPRERAEIKRALDADHSTLVFSWPRRHGKTATSIMIILWRFLSRRTENVAIVANSERQVVDTAFRMLRDAFEHTPFLQHLTSTGSIEVGADATHGIERIANARKPERIPAEAFDGRSKMRPSSNRCPFGFGRR